MQCQTKRSTKSNRPEHLKRHYRQKH
jgi:hypothetical protein